MSPTSLFRFILIASLMASITSVVAGISLLDTLPQILQDYMAQLESQEMSKGKALFLLLLVPTVLLLLLISTIGLWKFKSWARTLYVILLVAFIPLYPASGPVVMTSLEAMFRDIALVLEGVLLALMYTGEVNQKFVSTTTNENS
ncbi:hypothetical protein [Paraferrimonas haliotis]|uniref:DUF2127 domain-containing protein n=1 Tax=Paraferrimonas haliotis TaxID=2013866 RepID=A0AA37TYD8_9GAMM|nr:hypothetical protein [Paraferrimonas haliotis]GLS84550.1 hypothetical protein GCM10007894_25270 [Paraferrimonas haliotis]